MSFLKNSTEHLDLLVGKPDFAWFDQRHVTAWKAQVKSQLWLVVRRNWFRLVLSIVAVFAQFYWISSTINPEACLSTRSYRQPTSLTSGFNQTHLSPLLKSSCLERFTIKNLLQWFQLAFVLFAFELLRMSDTILEFIRRSIPKWNPGEEGTGFKEEDKPAKKSPVDTGYIERNRGYK